MRQVVFTDVQINSPTESCSSPGARILVYQSQSSLRMYLVGTDKHMQLTILSQCKLALAPKYTLFHYKTIEATNKFKNQPFLFHGPGSVYLSNESVPIKGLKLQQK